MAFVLSVLLFYSLHFAFYIFLEVVPKLFALHYPHSLLLLLTFFPLLLLIAKVLFLLDNDILVDFVSLTLNEELVFTVLEVDNNFLIGSVVQCL